ncbi:hypothetical protein DSL72_000201 [Monilinia vaccinii-corymbosi]|uniref:Uncharacterized protein n=1 Tax=Monilinia vaccinii-corymbosi TaxID=61207 RepID=A0A8A3NYN0_9HELO|nr:hypothetical protein DSL72_000201 [Monilinia vaccinii-corymbosi]
MSAETTNELIDVAQGLVKGSIDKDPLGARFPSIRMMRFHSTDPGLGVNLVSSTFYLSRAFRRSDLRLRWRLYPALVPYLQKGKARTEKGLKGGLAKLVFLTAAIFPEGFTHGPLPFQTIEGGAVYCATPEKLLLNDLGEDDFEKWKKVFKSQRTSRWGGIITYASWIDVPCVYLLAGATGSKVEKCAGGHMVMLNMPDKVAEVIKGAAT